MFLEKTNIIEGAKIIVRMRRIYYGRTLRNNIKNSSFFHIKLVINRI